MVNNLNNLFPKDLYHSYVILSNPDDNSIEKVIRFLESRNEINKNSPDVFCKVYESFKIEDSHLVREWHSRMGVTSSKKVCIIATPSVNREAMQSLLKMIEEPALNTHFFIIIPDLSILTDTILSRVQVVDIGEEDDKKIKEDVKSFIKLNYKDRFDEIAKIIKQNKNEEGSGNLRYYAGKFVGEIENIYYSKFKNDPSDKKNIRILEEIEKSKEYLKNSGASVKMILENLAIMI